MIDLPFLNSLRIAVLRLLKHNHPQISAKAIETLKRIELHKSSTATLTELLPRVQVLYLNSADLSKIAKKNNRDEILLDFKASKNAKVVSFYTCADLVESLRIPALLDSNTSSSNEGTISGGMDPQTLEATLYNLTVALSANKSKKSGREIFSQVGAAGAGGDTHLSFRQLVLLHLGAHRHVLKYIRRPLPPSTIIHCYKFLASVRLTLLYPSCISANLVTALCE